MTGRRAAACAPATIGNVGPGFDVLGLAVDGLCDRVTVEVGEASAADEIVEITGRDAGLVPLEAGRNAAAVAARAMLDRLGVAGSLRLWVDKALPVAGGLGGSAASSVAGALAAWLAVNHVGATQALPLPNDLIEAALAGEAAVAGRHLDNLAPCVHGGLTLVRSVDPPDIVKIPVPADWFVAVVTPAVRVETKAARAILPKAWEQASWVRQMANTTALAWAFASGDSALVRRALDDRYAEPRRASLIPRFAEVKAAAMEAGAMGCSISGSGPTVFALAERGPVAQACAAAMQRALGDIGSTAHVGAIARSGARPA